MRVVKQDQMIDVKDTSAVGWLKMPEDSMPKIVLLCWLAQPCPHYGPRRWWRDSEEV